MAAALCPSCNVSFAMNGSASTHVRPSQRSSFSPSFFGSQQLSALKLASVSDREGLCFKRRFCLEISAISSNDFRTGTNIIVDNQPWRVQEFLHVKPGKGAAFVRTKLRNYITGNTVEKTFRAGESLDEAYVQKDTRQHTYVDGDQLVFMDMETFEESRLNREEIGDKIKFLKEGMECSVLMWNERVLDVELPITVKYKIIETEPGVKGDTSGSGGTKPAKIDTGAMVQVPLFVNQDEEIMVDTRTGSYMSRVN